MSLGVLVAPAVAFTACGDKPVVVDGSTVRVELDEYRIVPQHVDVRAGRLRIVATNVGRLPHNLKIMRVREDELEAPGQEIGGIRSMHPAESSAVIFKDLKPGRYRMAGALANHDDLGQYGTLTVRER